MAERARILLLQGPEASGDTLGLPADAEVNVIAPEYVPAASPPGLTETAKAAGVVALAGETLSQPPPEVVEAEKETAEPVFVTETF